MKNVTSSSYGLEPPASESSTLRSFLIITQYSFIVDLQNKRDITVIKTCRYHFRKQFVKNKKGYIMTQIEPKFIKYPSITNSYALNPTTYRPFMNDEWIATEKIDGGNFNVTFATNQLSKNTTLKELSAQSDNETVKIYNRNFQLSENMPQYSPLFKLIRESGIIDSLKALCTINNAQQAMIYGEFFGKNLENQKTNYDVDKNNENSFRLFNVMTLKDDVITVQSREVLESFFQGYIVPVIARGTLMELLSQPLNEHSIYGGDSEGVVYQPANAYTIGKNRNTVFRAIKRKNKKFLEIKDVDTSNAVGKNGLVALQLEAYVTKNRVSNVLSHGDVTLEPKDTGKLIEAVKDDIFKEFKRDNPNTDVSDDYLTGVLKSLSGEIAFAIRDLRKS